MTATGPEAQQATLDAYDAVLDAVDALDEGAVHRAAGLLAAALGSEPVELVDEAADALFEAWANTEELWPDDPEEVLDRRGALLVGAMIVIGDRFPRPAFAGAYEMAALDRMEDDPERAALLAGRAVALAADADKAAGYRALQAYAVGAAGRLDEALALADEACGGASGLDTVDRAEMVRLEVMLQLQHPHAAALAATVFRTRGAEMPDDLGESVTRALLLEAGRLEARHEPPPPEIAVALRLALDRPAWRPDFLTEADWAVLVAWIDFLRDDHTRLAETLARAGGGPYSDFSLEGYAALLDAMVAFDAMDIAETERRLQRAAPIVERARDDKLTHAYRRVVDIMIEARSPRAQTGPAAPTWQPADLVLFQRAQPEIAAQSPTPETLSQLRHWREVGGSTGDAMLTGALWVLAAAGALHERDLDAAWDCLARAREVIAAFPDTSPVARWLTSLIASTEPALLAAVDRDAAIVRLRENQDRLVGTGAGYFAAALDTQLAVLLLPNDPRQALACAVQALTSLRRRRAQLPGISERQAMRDSLEALPHVTALRAAALIDDPRLTAELLEFLRSQDLPQVHHTPEVTQLPLAMLVPPPPDELVFFRDDPATSADVVALRHATPVLMPWGRLALGDLLEPPEQAPARLVVPR